MWADNWRIRWFLSSQSLGFLTQAWREWVHQTNGGWVSCWPSSGRSSELNKIFRIVESPQKVMAWDAYLFHGRIWSILLRILLHRDDYQFITPLLSIYTFITSFAASMLLKLSIEGSRGHWERRNWSFWVLPAVSFLASAPSALLLEVVSSICAPCMCSLLTDPEPQSQPGDHLTDLSGMDFMCTRPPLACQ